MHDCALIRQLLAHGYLVSRRVPMCCSICYHQAAARGSVVRQVPMCLNAGLHQALLAMGSVVQTGTHVCSSALIRH